MAYMLLGHGSEHLTRPRTVVPPGCMVVIAEECGSIGTLMPHIYEAMEDPAVAPLFLDPLRYRRALELLLRRPLKIYAAGTSIPALSLLLVNDDDPVNGPVGPSGVWPIPSPPGSLTLNPAAPRVERYLVDPANAGRTYAGSVFPFMAEDRAALAPLRLRQLRESPLVRVTLADLLTARPGVYIHLLCRALVGPNEPGLRATMRAAYPAEEHELFGRGAAAYNEPATIQDWITARRSAGLPVARSLTTLVDRVMERRQASRSSSERARLAAEEAWAELMRRIRARGAGASAEALRAAVAALPAAFLNQQESHDGGTLVLSAAREAATPAILTVLRDLVARGASVLLPDWEGRTPLHWAARTSVEATRILLDAGADTGAIDLLGNTVLHGAVAAAIPPLVAAGARPTLANQFGSTPLHDAAANGDANAVRALLAIPGVSVNALDTDGETPLMLAVRAGGNPATRVLLEAGAAKDTRRTDGRTALMVAMANANEDQVLLLLRAGAPVADWATLRRAAQTRGMTDVLEWIRVQRATSTPQSAPL
jgi:hypothetical protein